MLQTDEKNISALGVRNWKSDLENNLKKNNVHIQYVLLNLPDK